VVEFDATGAVVWDWKASDHFDPVKDSTFPEFIGTGYGVYHCNALDVDPENGNVLVSARDMDSVFYVERSSGKVLWKMGGKKFTKDGATYVAVKDPFYRQHDARLLPGWSSGCQGGHGQVSVFDDETAMPGPARGVVYDVTVGPADAGLSGCDGGAASAAGATVAWQHAGATSSDIMGSFRSASGGARVIGWRESPTQLTFTVVDSSGHDLVDFSMAQGVTSYRAIPVPFGAVDLDVLRNAVVPP